MAMLYEKKMITTSGRQKKGSQKKREEEKKKSMTVSGPRTNKHPNNWNIVVIIIKLLHLSETKQHKIPNLKCDQETED